MRTHGFLNITCHFFFKAATKIQKIRYPKLRFLPLRLEIFDVRTSDVNWHPKVASFFSVWQEVARLLDFDTLWPRLDANSLQIVDETHHASRFLGEVESDWWMGRLWSILSNLFGPAYCNPKSPANLGTRTPCWLPVRMVVWRVPWSHVHVLRRLATECGRGGSQIP